VYGGTQGRHTGRRDGPLSSNGGALTTSPTASAATDGSICTFEREQNHTAEQASALATPISFEGVPPHGDAQDLRLWTTADEDAPHGCGRLPNTSV
jgi:hypothetical protein